MRRPIRTARPAVPERLCLEYRLALPGFPVRDLAAPVESSAAAAAQAHPAYPRHVSSEGKSIVDQPSPRPPGFGVIGRLDDEHLVASLRMMSMGERLESGFELCEFASELAGSAGR